VNRRASLPGADELFRGSDGARGERARERREPAPTASAAAEEPPEASGRIRHDQKITVYVTGQELLDLEQARLRLRAEFDIAVDRGRIVREAVAELLQDLHDRGPDATIVRRLS
jgi:hypothetical protein